MTDATGASRAPSGEPARGPSLPGEPANGSSGDRPSGGGAGGGSPEGRLARVISWTVVVVAVLNVVYLITLPPLAGNAAERLDLPRPASLPPPAEPPEPRAEPVAPVEELREELRLPRVDESPDDEHSRASLAAYREGDYETAFEEAVLAMDPAPLPENGLYRALTTVSVRSRIEDVVIKPSGRRATGVVDRALQPVMREGDPEEMAARLNNAAVMLFLHTYEDYEPVPYEEIPVDTWVAEELAYQAAELRPDSCPALMNLTLFGGMRHGVLLETAFGVQADLDHGGKGDTWADYYPEASCDEPAFLYYRAQTSFTATGLSGYGVPAIEEALRLADRLQEDPRWAGLAHSLKGDANYWAGVYAVERTKTPRPFTADRHFEAALREYDAALALQPDDPAIRHGKALVYLQQGKAATRDDVNEAVLDKAIEEARAALDAAPGSPRLQQTLVRAHEEKGDHETAAELGRRHLSGERPALAPLTIVPYSAISHGADVYLEARAVSPEGGGAGGAFTDDEVIEPYVSRPYAADLPFAAFVPGGFLRYLDELRNYELLRDDVLGSDYASFREDLATVPEGVRRNERTLVLAGIARLLDQPEDVVAPRAETQAAIDAYLELPEKITFLPSGPSGSEPQWQGNDVFYREAGNLLREHKRYEDAVRLYGIWQAELERTGADELRRAEAHKVLGEARFLCGDDAGALAAFERAEGLRPSWPPYVTRQAFIHEKLEDYGRAEELYRRALETMREPADWMSPTELQSEEPMEIYYPDGYQASKHLGDVLLRQAEAAGAAGEEDRYARAARAYGDALEAGLGAPSAAAAVNNLGIALLKSGEHERSVEVLETLVLPPPDPLRTDAEEMRLLRALAGPRGIPDAWKEPNIASPPTPDENNPVFHLNLGWAHELNGKPKEAEEQYLAAVKSNPTFHPALNDLGVLAAEGERPEEAKAYFGAALDVKPDYAHASHNLGVTLLRSGPRGFLAGQGYLSRAVVQDPSLSQASYGHIFDNGLYFLELSLAGRVPPDWEFAEVAEEGVGVVSLLALALLLGRAGLGFARAKAQETILGRLFSEARRRGQAARLPRLLGRAREGWFRFLGFGVPTSGGPWSTPLALLVSAPAVALVMGWGLLWTGSEGRLLMLTTLFYLVVVSLLVHQAGHILVAMRFGMKTRGAPWPAGIVQALGLVAIGGPAVAPAPADLLEGGEGRDRERSLVYLAGPAASILFAVLLFGAFFVGPVPLLRLAATVNLSLAAVSLLLLPPLDGAMVGGQGRYARLLFWTGAALAVLAVVAYFGNDLFCRLGPGGSCWGI